VLTAAHCLVSEEATVRVQAINVLFGLDHGKPSQTAGVESYLIAPLFGPSDHRAEAAADDWAIITLDRDLFLRPIAVREKTCDELSNLSSQKGLFEIGYGMERPYFPTMASPCKVGCLKGGVFAFQCLSNNGYSGAPILTGPLDSVVIVGLVSRRSRDASVGVASTLSSLDFH
jgi:V8-like Glu-specific endopeptidase